MKSLLIILSVFSFAYTPLFSQLLPSELTCEYIKNPAVVDVLQPRLAWINHAKKGERGQKQTAFQIRVATSKDRLSSPDLWDSGKVNSAMSNRIQYMGKSLESGQDCWWQVKVWDRDGISSTWSTPAFWSMGILNTSEWQAKWIGAPWQNEDPLPTPGYPGATLDTFPPPAPLFRKEVNIIKKIKKAKAFVTGLGYFEFYVNGKKVGDDVLVPNQTNYGKRDYLMERNIPLPDDFQAYKVMYMAYDITSHLLAGDNVLGAILGNGFYNAACYWAGAYGSPRFLGQIHITYEDGSTEVIYSDESWKASYSPILMDMVYYGEIYDARLEQPGWCNANFNDDGTWVPATIREAPFGKLVAHTPHPDRVMERRSPVSIQKKENGNYLVDFGEEISGWVHLSNVSAPKGHKVELKFISNQYSGDNIYFFRGESIETYAPRFNWFVFSAVEILNWPGVLRADQITAEAVNTYVEESGHFETSNALFNEINKIWKRSQLDNMHGGLASDCPHRERSGYTGDGQVACVTAMHNFDTRSFYHKWIQDIWETQVVNTGYVPNGAPWQPGCGGGVAWGAAISIMPWEFYLHYGAIDILEDTYLPMKEYIRYMKQWVGADGIMFSRRHGKKEEPLKWFNLGDWCVPGEGSVPDEMVHTFYYWRCADLTAKTAKALGRSSEEKKFNKMAELTRNAFQKRFYNPEKGTYGPHGANIFALKMGVPHHQYDHVIKALKEDIKENDGHLDTGIFGTQFFFEILSEHGMHDLAFAAMNKHTQPSYGFWIAQGATTTREKWNNEGSHNHPMFGGGLVWFYRKLAGMNADPEQPGFKHIIFKPHPVEEMKNVTYENNTIYGLAGISWKNTKELYSMQLMVPVGSMATVYVPSNPGDTIYENGKLANEANQMTSIQSKNGYTVFKVNSGRYDFQVKKID